MGCLLDADFAFVELKRTTVGMISRTGEHSMTGTSYIDTTPATGPENVSRSPKRPLGRMVRTMR